MSGSQRNSVNKQSEQLLQACLDAYAHPVWITDANGAIILRNGHALQLGAIINNVNPSGTVSLKGRKYRHSQRELNHGTGCMLNELNATEEDTIRRVREATCRLAAVLEAT